MIRHEKGPTPQQARPQTLPSTKEYEQMIPESRPERTV
jgi:hypothetical protein